MRWRWGGYAEAMRRDAEAMQRRCSGDAAAKQGQARPSKAKQGQARPSKAKQEPSKSQARAKQEPSKSQARAKQEPSKGQAKAKQGPAEAKQKPTGADVVAMRLQCSWPDAARCRPSRSSDPRGAVVPSHALACIGHVDGKAHDRRSRDRQRVAACCAADVPYDDGRCRTVDHTACTNRAGVMPNCRPNARVRWLWSAKPASAAASAIGRPLASSARASRVRD